MIHGTPVAFFSQGNLKKKKGFLLIEINDLDTNYFYQPPLL